MSEKIVVVNFTLYWPLIANVLIISVNDWKQVKQGNFHDGSTVAAITRRATKPKKKERKSAKLNISSPKVHLELWTIWFCYD